MSEWISVDNQLPEDGQVVIVYGNGCWSIERFPYQYFDGRPKKEWFDCPATHWMPLPNPPEEKK